MYIGHRGGLVSRAGRGGVCDVTEEGGSVTSLTLRQADIHHGMVIAGDQSPPPLSSSAYVCRGRHSGTRGGGGGRGGEGAATALQCRTLVIDISLERGLLVSVCCDLIIDRFRFKRVEPVHRQV